MAEQMTKEEADALVTRNPVPPAERTIKTLEVDAGEPPAPDAAKPDVAALEAKLKAAEAKNEEYVGALKKKDSALADSKAETKAALETKEEEDTPKPNDDVPDLKVLIAEATVKSVADAMKAERKLSELDARTVREFGKKEEAKDAVEEYGAETAEKYREAAVEQQREYPGMTLLKAYKLVVPGGVKTAPTTPVESSRAAPPEVKPDSKKKAEDILAEAKGLNTRGTRLTRRALLEDYVKVQASSIFPNGGEG